MKLKFYLFGLLLLPFAVFSQTDEEIMQTIRAHQPLKGYRVPANISSILGTTHTGGKYYFTTEPFLIEGAKKIEEIGFGVAKFFVGGENLYPFNSPKWSSLPRKPTPLDYIKHEYFVAALSRNFSTIILNVTNLNKPLLEVENADFSSTYNEIYDLTKYLLTTYRSRNVDFIIKNWEGDWLLRGGDFPTKETWMAVPECTRKLRIRNMIKWVQTRQLAIEAARRDAGSSSCKVYHALECNKVIESMSGVDGVASHVLPAVKVDIVSWSSYDGMKPVTNLYKGVEYLKKQIKPSAYMQDSVSVMLGEIGTAENDKKWKGIVTPSWDEFMGVCFALNVSRIVQWEIYCNEPSIDNYTLPITNPDNLRGFWLIKPDGTDGETFIYFKKLLANKGKIITE